MSIAAIYFCFWFTNNIVINSNICASLQSETRVHDYIDSQPEISEKMRAILIDWLIEVHHKFELNPETLYLTINIVDRYLAVETSSRRELQLVGISAMLIASKYEEIWAPEVYFMGLSNKIWKLLSPYELLMAKANNFLNVLI